MSAPTQRPRRDPAPDGLLIIDKPDGWTSHDVVAKVRYLAATRKVGHAGTLDPMATGVLVLGIGRATKLLTFLVGADKAYDATIRLGATSVTDDADGEITATTAVSELSPRRLGAAVAALTGELLQVPSAVSAIKVDGRRAYARVRGGEEVALAPRPVTISRFEIVATREVVAHGIPMVDVDVSVEVSSGTYVRALARDLGAALGVGGHLIALRRTRVGAFELDAAHTLASLSDVAPEALPITPLAACAAAFATRHLSESEARAIGFGQR
ncbi:MAG: tRNA pseudouridine(55) synthase TruB, partial [Nostocoides sp.]